MTSVALRPAAASPAVRVASLVEQTASQPWAPGDALRLLVLQVVGAFVVLGAWVGTAGSSRLSHQFAWTSLGVVGFLLAATGTGAWLLTGRRAVGLRLQRLLIESEVTRQGYGAGVQLSPAVVDAPARTPLQPVQGLVAVDGAIRFHRPDCVLVRGKDVQPQALSSHVRHGRRACELCAPDEEAAA